MAITAAEMNNLRDLVGDVVEQRLNPKFEAIAVRFDGIDARLDGIDGRLYRIEDDVAAIKEMVKDHSFDIARLKYKKA